MVSPVMFMVVPRVVPLFIPKHEFSSGSSIRSQNIRSSTVRDQLCATLGATTGVQSKLRTRTWHWVSQSATRIPMMSHQKAQKGWHITGLWPITGRHITGPSQSFKIVAFLLFYFFRYFKFSEIQNHIFRENSIHTILWKGLGREKGFLKSLKK